MPNHIFPAEWEKHSAVWLAWQHDEISFPGRVEKVENSMTEFIKAVHTSEMVNLLVLDEKMKEKAQTKLKSAGVDLLRVNFKITEYMDAWMRDTGVLFVRIIPLPSGERLGEGAPLAIASFTFNIWGNKFPDLEIDKQIPEKVSSWTNLPLIKSDIVLEGGSLDVNGEGLCLTTEQCLLNENRNPGRSKEDVEKELERLLGVKKTIWLKKGLVNDHTDGHIDEIARFVSPDTVVVAYEENEKKENYKILNENYEQLLKETNLNGKALNVVKLPIPHVQFKDAPAGNVAGSIAPVSYTNFYIGNEVVVVPVFEDVNDQKALKIIQDLFPTRKVVPLHSLDLAYGGGGIHCLTQQQPT
ncbi:MAG: agmatine deiminase family protein [Candidatus Doudnabacteria bacterium]|nr:agmatine deiminase family protein [Candidatus Doudnabacteria bacterium]